MPDITFLAQSKPVDEYGRASYAVCRSVLRAHFDKLSQTDLEDLNWLFIIEGVGVVCGVRRVVAG